MVLCGFQSASTKYIFEKKWVAGKFVIESLFSEENTQSELSQWFFDGVGFRSQSFPVAES